MFILFGQSIDNGMTFIGPFDTEAEVRATLHNIDFDEAYQDLALIYDFEVIELHQSPMDAQSYPETMTQVL